MKLLRKIAAAVISAAMVLTSAVSAGAVNIAEYYDEMPYEQVMEFASDAADGKTYDGYFEQKYDKYWYKLNCTTAGTLTLTVEVGVADWSLDLYDSNGDNVKPKKCKLTVGSGAVDEYGNLALKWDKTKKTTKITATYTVKKGTYVTQICSFQTETYTGKVRFTASLPKASASSSSSSSASGTKSGVISALISDIQSDSNAYNYLGQDLYCIKDSSGKRNIYRIDETVLENWRKTGKIKAQKITVASSIANHSGWGPTDYDFSAGIYGVFAYTENDVVYYHAVKYNAAKNKITSYYKTTVPIGVSPKGYISQFVPGSDGNKITLTILNASGKKVKTLNFDTTGTSWSYWRFARNEYCGLSVRSYNQSTGEWSGKVYLIDHSGKKQTFVNYPIRSGALWSNYFATGGIPMATFTQVYSFDTKKTYNLNKATILTQGKKEYDLLNLGEKLYGTKAAACYKYQIGDADPEYLYALIDVSTNKFISKTYKYMISKDDGKTYLVQSTNGKWGYIDSNGKELGLFDDAAVFTQNSDYAPVFKNGKVYFVDRNMKQVSKAVTLSDNPNLNSLGANVYFWYDGSRGHFMTCSG